MMRMYLVHQAGSELLGSYMMILPIIGLFLAISQAGIPHAFMTLISKNKQNTISILKTCLFLTTIQSIICIGLIILFRQNFQYLKLIIPFVILCNLSAILRSYFIAKSKAVIPALANILEECIRLVILMLFFKVNPSLEVVLTGMFCGELVSFLFMACCIKHKPFQKLQFKNHHLMYKEVLSISFPTSITQLLHMIGHAFEPVIYQYSLQKANYTTRKINETYGLLNGQILSLLMIPTFLNSVTYRLFLPKMANNISNQKAVKHLLLQGLLISLGIGIPCAFFFYFFSDFSLQLLYNTTKGSNYLKYLAIPFTIYYLQTPLVCFIQASCLDHLLVIASFMQSLVTLVLLRLLLPIYYEGAYLFCFLCGLLTSTLIYLFIVYKTLFQNKK